LPDRRFPDVFEAKLVFSKNLKKENDGGATGGDLWAVLSVF
jgi:hypothetical protein